MLKTIIPQSDLLRKYIEVFYVFTPGKPKQFSYIAFPHINTAISFFSGVNLTRKDPQVIIQENLEKANHNSVEILGKYTRPVLVHYEGDFEEIAIVFKPLGVNHFIRGNLLDIAPEYSQPLLLKNWIQCCNKLFEHKENQTGRLEKFLLENFNEANDLKVPEIALKYLTDPDAEYSIEEVAASAGMTLKTFQRFFMKQLTCTPSEYKRIARFRNALNSKLLSDDRRSLTSITYENNYYDQSYLIREFRKLTNLNPKKFFSEISVLDENKIIWELK